MAELQRFNPNEAFGRGEQAGRQDLQLEQQKQVQALQFMNKAARSLVNVPEDQKGAAFQRLQQIAPKFGVDPAQFTPDQITPENLQSLISQTDALIRDPRQLQDLTSKERDRTDLIRRLKSDDPVIKAAAERESGALARAVGSGAQTIAATGVSEDVAKSQAIIKGAEETAKLEKQLEFEPQIKAAVKKAEVEAAARGETNLELIRSVSALPALEDVVDKLKVLSEKATFTLAGKGFNAVAKQLGISTSGDTALKSMTSMVDNQVLKMLKPIFGAAFTAVEGDRLRNAFLDPDSTPDSRKAALDSFINAFREEIETKKREVSAIEQQQSGQNDGQAEIDALRAELGL